MITNDDVTTHYVCVDCYSIRTVEIAQYGSSTTQYKFDTDDDALQHLDDTEQPGHSLSVRIVRLTPAEVEARSEQESNS